MLGGGGGWERRRYAGKFTDITRMTKQRIRVQCSFTFLFYDRGGGGGRESVQGKGGVGSVS